jgi:signal transduction histidine kinase
MKMSGTTTEIVSAKNGLKGRQEPDAQLAELYGLSAEIVDLFYTQTLSPDTVSTPADVCDAFANIIQRRWDLCCIVIYLRDEDGHLHEGAIHTHEHFDEGKARDVSAQFATEVERVGAETQAWLDEKEATKNGNGTMRLRRKLKAVSLRAGVAVPIQARGTLVGALIAMTAFPERLSAALNGIRFLAAPIVIGVANARRAEAMREQHQRIEHLVEQLQLRTNALELANRELRHVAHYRSLFLGRMSHELRTPLTSILGFAEILLDHEELNPCQRRFVEKIQSSGLQLQSSLNQLVDLSRLEAGQSELFLHEFSLKSILDESCNAVARLAQKQSVEIDCVADPNLPSIVSDEGKLRQVLYNFFAHAISRSPEGKKVRVRAGHLPASRFQILIEDRGEPPSDISHIFEPIEISAPSESATNMNELGLVIAHRLIALLGGEVKLETEQPRGLKVAIELPIRPTEGRQKNSFEF